MLENEHSIIKKQSKINTKPEYTISQPPPLPEDCCCIFFPFFLLIFYASCGAAFPTASMDCSFAERNALSFCSTIR